MAQHKSSLGEKAGSLLGSMRGGTRNVLAGQLVSQLVSLAALAALFGALPLALLQTYRFARSGLTTHERGFAQRAIPLSLALFVGGTALGWGVVLPRLLPLLAGGPGEAQFSLAQTVGLLLSLSLGTGIALQLPLLAFMAKRSGVWDGGLTQARKLAWGLLLALALFVTPDPSTIGLASGLRNAGATHGSTRHGHRDGRSGRVPRPIGGWPGSGAGRDVPLRQRRSG